MNRLGEEFDETSADGRTCKVENCSHLQGSYLRFHHSPSHPSPDPQSSSLLPSLSSIFLNPYFAITLFTIFSAQTLVVLDRNKMTSIFLLIIFFITITITTIIVLNLSFYHHLRYPDPGGARREQDDKQANCSEEGREGSPCGQVFNFNSVFIYICPTLRNTCVRPWEQILEEEKTLLHHDDHENQ